MTEWLAAAVAFAAATGAVLRHAVSVHLTRRSGSSGFPWSTWLVNCCGAALFGLCLHALDGQHKTLLWIELFMGFSGGFTTLSAWSVESVAMFRHNRLQAASYCLSTVGVGMAILLLTWRLG